MSKKEVKMSELTEKQKCYARYLAKLPAAKRNLLFSKMKPSFSARLNRYIVEEVKANQASLAAVEIAALEPLVKKMYLDRLKITSPIKYAFLAPMVSVLSDANGSPKILMTGRLPGRKTLFKNLAKVGHVQC